MLEIMSISIFRYPKVTVKYGNFNTRDERMPATYKLTCRLYAMEFLHPNLWNLHQHVQ